MTNAGNIDRRTNSVRPALRLVGAEGASAWIAAAKSDVDRSREVARENLLSSDLTVEDARSVFANQVEAALEGGRAAILNPIRRRELVGAAVASGLRPFDANLVIAIVQDAARGGAGPKLMEQRVAVVREAEKPRRVSFASLLMASATGAATIFLILRWWVAGR